MAVWLATSMAMVEVPVLVTIGTGNEACCSNLRNMLMVIRW